MASKIDPFADLLGRVPDDRIAEMAGVALSTVGAYRRRVGIAAAADPAPDAHPPAELSSPAEESNEEADTFSFEPVQDVPPPSVRVLATRWIARWMDGQRPRKVGRRDVYNGSEAAWLWEHHRDLVEPFPSKG